jgi:hypothetical protein
MNGRSQMQGDENWILPKEINANRFFRDSLAGNLEKPFISLSLFGPIEGQKWYDQISSRCESGLH